MDFLKFLAVETYRFCVGLYGLLLLVVIYWEIEKLFKRVVKLVGIQKDKFIRFKTRRI